jgi:hypothetical protein
VKGYRAPTELQATTHFMLGADAEKTVVVLVTDASMFRRLAKMNDSLQELVGPVLLVPAFVPGFRMLVQ